MRTVKVVRDPKAFELVADETRRKMIYLLRAKEYSVNQLAQELSKTPQAIYHHVRKLSDAGLIEVAREERIGHLVETYYRATAEVFQFSHGVSESGSELEEKRMKEALEALAKVGLPVHVDDELVSKTVKLLRRSGSLGLKPEVEDKIASMEDIGFITKQDVTEFTKFLLMTDKQFEEYGACFKELRSLLKSRMAQPLQEVARPKRTAS